MTIDGEIFDKFFNDEDVDGISPVTDSILVDKMRHKLESYVKCPKSYFKPGNWPVNLSRENINQLVSNPYVVAPKPFGTRYLLYIESAGDVFMENIKNNFFQLDAVKIVSLSSNDTVLDGYFARSIKENRLTFVIHDAIRCNGVDLTKGDVIERITTVKVYKSYLS